MEKVTEEQKRLTDELIDIMIGGVREQQAAGRYTRAAHAKTVGLMKAEFRVEDDLPEKCRAGIFEKPATYKALIRGSHSSPSRRKDKRRDARGMAIKLLEVEGERLGEYNCEKATQDFILISWPAFFFSGLKTFTPCARLFTQRRLLAVALRLISTGQFKTIYYVFKAFQQQTSLLDIQFWSMTPYKLGESFVKYTIIPTSSLKSTKPDPLTDSYLSQNMDRHLSMEDATFDFCVQFYQDDKTTSLDDNMQIWNESDSPYVKVATITIPKQRVGTQERFTFGEDLSYSPGHCLKAHQPVGELNYARLRAYEAVSNFRLGVNCCERCEPTIEDFDRLK